MTIDQNTKELLEQLSNTSHGIALKKVLEQAVDELNDVSSITNYEELLGRKFALHVLEDIFKFMSVKFVDKKSKNQYT